MEEWKEAIDRLIKNRDFVIQQNETIREEVKKFDVFRDKNKSIVIDVVYDGWLSKRNDNPPAGSLKVHDGKIVFKNVSSGRRGEATGVVHRHYRCNSKNGIRETVETFTAHAIHLETDCSQQECFCVEHIDNLSTSFLWPDMIDFEETTLSTTVLTWKQGSLTIPDKKRRYGGSRGAMHLKLNSYDLVLCADDRKNGKRAGKIVYLGNPDKFIRDKMREVISFVCGRPIIYYGHTSFSNEWYPLKAVSVDAYSINGTMFQLHALPPYPICKKGTKNSLDGAIVQSVCKSILDHYDQLDFQKSSWAYWHAISAPYHMEAAHFGALVEKVQNAVVKKFLPKDERNLFTAEAWKKFRSKVLDLIEAADIEEENKARLSQAVNGIGRVPQALTMARLFKRLDVPLGEVETRAWQQRNDAAHGIMKDDYLAIILNNKVLRLIFHRLVAGITKCIPEYIDYYNINFPIRHLQSSLPERPN